MSGFIDLRSDTVTKPTREMRQAMAEAEVGDDIYGEDPTANRLQERAAEIFERESALFVPSGSMGNQIAVNVHTRHGQEVVVEERAHIFNYEMATMAAVSGCLARPVPADRGHLQWEQVEPVLNVKPSHRTSTGLVALENSHNQAGGTVMEPEAVGAICDKVHSVGLPVHLDGARIFNSATTLGTTVVDLTLHCDSVMFCLSKGLSAPVGSMLVGSSDFIEEALRVRKMLGGAMRQVGVLAAAGLVALEHMPKRLAEDHENARLIAAALHELAGLRVDLENVQTNIVMVDLEHASSAEFLGKMKEEGVLAGAVNDRRVRFVTHKDVSRQDVQKAIDTIRRVEAQR